MCPLERETRWNQKADCSTSKDLYVCACIYLLVVTSIDPLYSSWREGRGARSRDWAVSIHFTKKLQNYKCCAFFPVSYLTELKSQWRTAAYKTWRSQCAYRPPYRPQNIQNRVATSIFDFSTVVWIAGSCPQAQISLCPYKAILLWMLKPLMGYLAFNLQLFLGHTLVT